MRLLYFVFLIFLFGCQKETPDKQDSFIEFTQATDVPQKFGEGVITSVGKIEFGVVYDHFYNDLYFTRLNPGTGAMTIYTMHDTGDGKWEKARIASFSGTYRDACPVIVNNGNRLYFTSNRQSTFSKIWFCERGTDNTWKEPQSITFPDSVKTDIRNICFVNDSVLYFDMTFRDFDNDIFRAVIRNDKCVLIQHTGPKLNSANPENEPAVNPAETFMIFYSIGREGHLGDKNAGDLYVSYKENGEWTSPKNLGTPINSQAEENWPSVDFVNNVLYFCSNRDASGGFPGIYHVKLDKYLK